MNLAVNRCVHGYWHETNASDLARHRDFFLWIFIPCFFLNMGFFEIKRCNHAQLKKYLGISAPAHKAHRGALARSQHKDKRLKQILSRQKFIRLYSALLKLVNATGICDGDLSRCHGRRQLPVVARSIRASWWCSGCLIYSLKETSYE